VRSKGVNRALSKNGPEILTFLGISPRKACCNTANARGVRFLAGWDAAQRLAKKHRSNWVIAEIVVLNSQGRNDKASTPSVRNGEKNGRVGMIVA